MALLGLGLLNISNYDDDNEGRTTTTTTGGGGGGSIIENGRYYWNGVVAYYNCDERISSDPFRVLVGASEIVSAVLLLHRTTTRGGRRRRLFVGIVSLVGIGLGMELLLYYAGRSRFVEDGFRRSATGDDDEPSFSSRKIKCLLPVFVSAIVLFVREVMNDAVVTTEEETEETLERDGTKGDDVRNSVRGDDEEEDEMGTSAGERVVPGSSAYQLRRNKRDVSVKKLRRRMARKYDPTDVRRSMTRKLFSPSREERPIIPLA
eukprot:CAMPEP_0172488140 /NCGR_PEP_ID=MMETSP1066-20121228/17537_1 /TAXON_ID=671091 /ORGANISM="Coscinodiscus wailesii, Strain CCMP2513" /LENGTH=261 /DNA_ID=CAMNT_0013255175 /DNA_START=311 /DNA_END=1096 /DNA_ORIENTATION=+